MKVASERKLIRGFSILASIPIVGYIYGPVTSLLQSAFAVKFFVLPTVVLSGFGLWLGYYVKKWWHTRIKLAR